MKKCKSVNLLACMLLSVFVMVIQVRAEAAPENQAQPQPQEELQAPIQAPVQQVPKAAVKEPVKQKLFFAGFSGFVGDGTVAPPITYEGGNSGMVPIENAYGFGINIEYTYSPGFRLFFDGMVSSYQKLVANKDGYGTGFWVYEQTDYESHSVGPFPYDCHYFMDTTGFRIGSKWAVPGSVSPWFGLGLGFYSWTASFMNAERTKQWGSVSGTTTGITYLLGIDFKPKDNSFIFTVFFDGASPVANPKFENLFHDGWTWNDITGTHVIPPYRFGMTLSLPL